jgi:hypothetical protein
MKAMLINATIAVAAVALVEAAGIPTWSTRWFFLIAGLCIIGQIGAGAVKFIKIIRNNKDRRVAEISKDLIRTAQLTTVWIVVLAIMSFILATMR